MLIVDISLKFGSFKLYSGIVSDYLEFVQNYQAIQSEIA